MSKNNKKAKGGRPEHKGWKDLFFLKIRDDQKNKNYAKCVFCEKILKNTSLDRLQTHRNGCLPVECNSGDEIVEVEVPVSAPGEVEGPYEVIGEASGVSRERETKTYQGSAVVSKKLKQTKLPNYLDVLSEKDSELIDMAIGRFFFSTNISFRVIEEPEFVNFVKLLRPSYKIPTRKFLGREILNKVVDQTVSKIETQISSLSTVLVDGWKNPQTNEQMVAFILQTSDGHRAFLDAFNFTSEKLGKTGRNLYEKLEECKKIAKDKFNTTIYAVISDNARNMLLMGRLSDLWHIPCSSHTANLLLKDVLNENLLAKVVRIVKQFRNTGPAEALKNLGGTKLIRPVDTRWCSYRNTFKCFVRNLQLMKNVIADGACSKYFSTETIIVVYDEEFLDELRAQIELMDPICELINKCQSLHFCVADACEMWYNLSVPPEHQKSLEHRRSMALTVYSKTANFLDPKYRGQRLSESDVEEVEMYLISVLSAQGIASLEQFKNKTDFFSKLESKQFCSSLLYWKSAKTSLKLRELSELAIKLLSLPASTGELERVFSNWKFIHSPLRNRLNFITSKKLVETYYNLNAQHQNERYVEGSESESEVEEL